MVEGRLNGLTCKHYSRCPKCGSREEVTASLEGYPHEVTTGENWVKCAKCGKWYDP